MSGSPTSKYETYVCPEWVEERLRDVGGENRYGGNCFILRWGQGGQDECYYRAGGAWTAPDEPTFTGYRNLLISGTPSWALMEWRPPEHYGSPELWYMQGFDEETSLQTLGEFPYIGKYELLYNLRWTERTKDGLLFESMPLNSFLIDSIIPIILSAKEISREKTLAAMKDIEARENAKDTAQIEEIMHSAALPWRGSPVSYGKQGCRTSLVDRKIEKMQRQWSTMMTNAKALGRGLSSHAHNPVT